MLDSTSIRSSRTARRARYRAAGPTKGATVRMLCASLVLFASLAIDPGAVTRAADKHAHEHGHEPRHGGVVVEVKDVDYELVAKPALLQLYLRDHGKPVDVGQASAKLTLLSGSRKSEAVLQPVGDRLEATGNFDIEAGTKVIATVSRSKAKPVNVRFELK